MLDPLETPSSALAEGSLIEELTEICGGDEDFAHELALTFLQSAPSCLAGIEHALESGDWRELSAEAHALKGISRTIGAARLADVCVDLEHASNRKDLVERHGAAADLAGAWVMVKTTLEDFLAVEVKA